MPELFAAQATAQVQVSIGFGQVPQTLTDALFQTPWFAVSPNAYLLRVAGIAYYYVQDGERITIAPDTQATQEDIRAFLLTSVMAQLLHQRRVLVLHGAAALVGNKAVLLLGESVVGKTALALALYRQGYPIAADELCAITLAEGKAKLLPGIPRLAAWHDTLTHAGLDPAAYPAIRQCLHKYSFPVKEHFQQEAAEIANIILVGQHKTPDIVWAPVYGTAKFSEMIYNIYQPEAKMIGKQNTDIFQHTVALTQCANVYRLTYDMRFHQPEEMAAWILRGLVEHV